MTKSRDIVPANRLLSALSSGSLTNFLGQCDKVELVSAQLLCEPGDVIRHVYFPLASFISLITTLNGGARLEVGIIGDEGMLGTTLLLGGTISPQHALVQGAGTALRMSAARFRSQVSRNKPLRLALHRYVLVLIDQLAQTAACARFHLVEERLARWLLLTRDRAHADQFRMTHEFLAYMLGVRRVGITQAARSLQAQGLIAYRRGEIVILDNRGLEKASCRCYLSSGEMYDEAMGDDRRVSLLN